MDYKELKQKADLARRNRNWKEAVLLYENITKYENSSIWDLFFYAMSLNKTDKFERSLQLCRNIYLQNKNFLPNKNLYAANIFMMVIKYPENQTFNYAVKALNAIVKIAPVSDDYFSVDEYFYKFFAELEKNKKFKLIIELCQNIDIQAFENLPRTKSDKKENVRFVFPQPKETCMTMCVKSNFFIKNYQETVRLTSVLLSEFKRLSFGNDVWMRRYRAKAFAEMNDFNKAIEEYFRILNRKKDWFLLFELAEIIAKTDETEAVYYFLAKAVEDNQNPEFKIKMLEFCYNEKIEIFDEIVLKKILCLLYKKYGKIKNLCQNFDIENENLIKLYKILQEQAHNYLYESVGIGFVYKNFGLLNGLLSEKNKKIFFVSEKKFLPLTQETKVKFVIGFNYDFKQKKIKKCAVIIEKL